MIGKEYVSQVVSALVSTGAHRAVKIVSPSFVVRATRKLVQGKVPRRGNIEAVLTIGRPNYRERKFIKLCQKAGEPFPVRKVQVKHPPKPKRKR